MREFSVQGVEVLSREQAKIGKDYDTIAVKYFDIAKRYCLKRPEYQELLDKYTTELSIDIEKLASEVSPLSYSAPFPLSSSHPSEWDDMVATEFNENYQNHDQSTLI